MQIVSNGDNLHETSNPIFWIGDNLHEMSNLFSRRLRKKFEMSAEIFT